jgi:hypothetical protein
MEIQKKSYWSKPEGIFSIILSVLLLGTATWSIFNFLPIIIKLLQNTLYLSIFLIAFSGIVFFLFDPKVRTLAWYMYKAASRWFASLFVEIDPIMVLNSRLNNFEKKLVNVRIQKGKLGVQKNNLYELIYNNQKEISNNLAQADDAKAANESSKLLIKTRKAGRLQDSNMRLDELYQKMDNLYKIISRMYANSKIVLEDTKDTIKIKTDEQKAIRASHSAMQNAMEIIQGNDKSQSFELAMENITTDINSKLGEMDQFMQLSDKFMQSIDLKNGVLQEEGLEMLENWEKKNTLFLNDSPVQSVSNNSKKEAIPLEKDDDNVYESLFK